MTTTTDTLRRAATKLRDMVDAVVMPQGWAPADVLVDVYEHDPRDAALIAAMGPDAARVVISKLEHEVVRLRLLGRDARPTAPELLALAERIAGEA